MFTLSLSSWIIVDCYDSVMIALDAASSKFSFCTLDLREINFGNVFGRHCKKSSLEVG